MFISRVIHYAFLHFSSTLLGALSCGVLILICFITTGVISSNDHIGGLLDGG